MLRSENTAGCREARESAPPSEELDSALWGIFTSEGEEPANGQEAPARRLTTAGGAPGGGEGARARGEREAQPEVRRHSLELAGLQGELKLLASQLEEANRQRRRLSAEKEELAQRLACAEREIGRLTEERDQALGRAGEALRDGHLRAQGEERQGECALPPQETPGAEWWTEFAQQETREGTLELREPWPDQCAEDPAEPGGEGVSAGPALTFPLLGELLDEPSARTEESCWTAGQFLLRPEIPAIEYDSPDQLELYQSVNVAYLAPEGKGQENCRGYLCVLRDGKGARVMAALYGLKSGRAWVYLPERQPADDSTCAKALREAIAFAEQVGFMMEAVQAPRSQEQYRELALSCPVLRCTARPAA